MVFLCSVLVADVQWHACQYSCSPRGKSLSSRIIDDQFTSPCPCPYPWTTKSLKIFKDFACCKLSVMYDYLTSINFVTAAVTAKATKSLYLLNTDVNFKFTVCQCVIARTLFFIFMANKVPAVVKFACTLKSLFSSHKCLTTTLTQCRLRNQQTTRAVLLYISNSTFTRSVINEVCSVAAGLRRIKWLRTSVLLLLLLLLNFVPSVVKIPNVKMWRN